jgi:mannose-6-phosphate isomerase-like protein (cupin superfamily)
VISDGWGAFGDAFVLQDVEDSETGGRRDRKARGKRTDRRVHRRGQANPSLVTVDRVARALGTDFASLSRDTQPDPVAVNEPGSAAGVWSSAAGSRAELQVATQRQPSAELWEWVLQPGDRYDAQPDAAGSEELFLVLDGALTLEVEGLEPVTVKAGGSARLASDRGYAYANHCREPARYVRVVRLG